MQSLPNLEDYQNYSPTSNCYLDGRYFNLVFANYFGLIKHPLVITLVETEGDIYMDVHMEQSNIDLNTVGLLRVVIQTPTTRHSALIILHYIDKVGYLYDPISHRYNTLVRRIVEKYLNIYGNYKVVTIQPQNNNVKNPNCPVSGFCNAYVIKYAYDYLLGRPFDSSKIREFAQCIESTYGVLDGPPEVEYGNGNVFGGVMLGALGGAAIGGLVGGGQGILPGMAIGGLTGGLLSR